MANTVIALRSSGAVGNVPNALDLEYGEFALNYADGIIYYRTDSDTVGSILTTQPAGLTTEVQFNDGGSFGSSANLTFDKSNGKLSAISLNAETSIVATTGTLETLTASGAIQGNTLSTFNTLYVGTDATVMGDISANNITLSNTVQSDTAIIYTKLYAGIATNQSTELPNVIAQFSSNAYTYTQVNQQNIDGHGSADFVITADVGDDATFYTDVGMSGSQYNYYDGYDTPFEPLTGYFLVQGNTGQVGGNMIIGTTAESTNIRFIAGGFESSNIVMEMDNDGVTSTKVLTAPTFVSTNISTDIVSATGNVYADQVFANNKLWAGSATELGTELPDVIAQFTSNSASYTQVNQQNINEHGTSDYVLTADVGNDTDFYVDVGIINSQYDNESPDNSLGTAAFPLDGYFYVQGSTIGQVGGNLIIGTTSTSAPTELRVIIGGGNAENVVSRFTDTGVYFAREIISATTDRIYNWANAAYDAANTYILSSQANTGAARLEVLTYTQSSFDKANSANSLAQQAYDAANVAGGNAFTTISAVGFDDVIANTKTSKITVLGQTGIAIGTDATNSTITIATNLIGASNVVLDFGTVTDSLGTITFDYGFV